MKICVSAVINSLSGQVDQRFGRCPYFIIVDIDSLNFEALPNTSRYASGGAGIQAAQTIANKGAELVITGNIGPNAFQALSSVGIQVVTGVSGTVQEIVEKYKKGELREGTGPTVDGHFGLRRRREKRR